jgi:hypothetical protein
MRIIKKTFLICLLASFCFVSSIAPLYAGCKCSQMSTGDDMSNMPCHNMQQSMGDSSSNANDMMVCLDCGCGDCKTPSQSSNLHQPTSASLITKSIEHMMVQQSAASFILSIIDTPPKYIS